MSAADDDNPLARITALLNKREATRCPMCRQNQWEIPKDRPFTTIPVHEDSLTPSRPDSPWFPAYVLYCGNCGFVSLHMKYIVDPDPDEEPENE